MVVLALWFLVQFSLMARQLAGVTNVSATGHLGGALVGAILWLYWRES